MLLVPRRSLTTVILLTSVGSGLILAAAGLLAVLLPALQGSGPAFLENWLDGLKLSIPESQLRTLSGILLKAALSGAFAASCAAVLLWGARPAGRPDQLALDERTVGLCALILWFVVFNLFFPEPYGDEYVHQRAIAGIHRGDWDWTNSLSMIPGYHFAAAVASMITGPHLIVSRAVTLAAAAGTVLLYHEAAKTWQGAQAGQTALALALLPILFPFAVTVYTDAASMLLIAAALWALGNGRYHISAVMMLGSCFVRQSNLVWLAFMAVLAIWMLWREWPRKPSSARHWWEFARACLPRVSGYVVAALAFLAFVLATTKGLIWGADVHLNRARPNIAQLYTVSFFVLLLWAPVWIERLPADARSLRNLAGVRPARSLAVIAVLLLVGATLVGTYQNFHPWNQYWYYLRNNPLVWMEQYPALRVVGVLAVYWAAWAAFRFWKTQPYRAELAMVAGFTTLFLAPQALVEPRYFVVPFALLNLFFSYSPGQMRRLTTWWAVLCILICSAVLLAHLRYEFIAW